MKKVIILMAAATLFGACQKQNTKPAVPTIEEKNAPYKIEWGHAMFWTNDGNCIVVTIDGKQMQLIGSATEPPCTHESMRFILKKGSYNWTAIDSVPGQGQPSIGKWSGTLTILAEGDCVPVRLSK